MSYCIYMYYYVYVPIMYLYVLFEINVIQHQGFARLLNEYSANVLFCNTFHICVKTKPVENT